MAEEVPAVPPPDLVQQLEQNVGTPPPINNPATDMKDAMAFHNLHINDWKLTIREYFIGPIDQPPT